MNLTFRISVAKVEAGRLRPCGRLYTQSLEEAIALFHMFNPESYRVVIQVRIDGQYPALWVDPEALSDLMNDLDRTRDALRDGPSIDAGMPRNRPRKAAG